jgi:hypothetical protein
MDTHYSFRTGDGPLDRFVIDIDSPDKRPENTVLLLASAELIAANERIRREADGA